MLQIRFGHVSVPRTSVRRIEDPKYRGFEVSVRGWYCTVKRTR